MRRSYRYWHLDVFTDRVFGGNQLAVYPDAGGLADATMQAIAREMNFSETTFVLPPEQAGTDARLRIFTPGSELPMAGHPTIGSAFALAHAGVIPPGAARFVFGLGIGPTPVTLDWRGADLRFAWMTQLPPAFHDPLTDRSLAAAALGLPVDRLADASLPVQVISCGLPYVLVPLATRQAVDDAVVDLRAYGELVRRAPGDASGLFAFSCEPGADGATVYSRMFAPVLGVFEDPATGSASGPAGCYLVRHGLVPPGRAGAIRSRQGVKMGRPSDVYIAIGVEGEAIRSVRVGGEAVLAGEGTLYVS